MLDDNIEDGIDEVAVNLVRLAGEAAVHDEGAVLGEVILEDLVLSVQPVDGLDKLNFIFFLQCTAYHPDADHAVEAVIKDNEGGELLSFYGDDRAENDGIQSVLRQLLYLKAGYVLFLKVLLKFLCFCVHDCRSPLLLSELVTNQKVYSDCRYPLSLRIEGATEGNAKQQVCICIFQSGGLHSEADAAQVTVIAV